MDVYVGDRVQILSGGVDVTNGLVAKAGKMYGEGGPLWATVEIIDPTWKTGSRWGLPSTVKKVRCVNNGIVVWQVQPKDIAPNVIRASKPDKVQKKPTPSKSKKPEKTDTGESDLDANSSRRPPATSSNYAYVTTPSSESWGSGDITSSSSTGTIPKTASIQTKLVSGNQINSKYQSSYPSSTADFRELNSREKRNIGGVDMRVSDGALNGGIYQTSWQNDKKRNQMLNEDIDNIQNDQGFPAKSSNANGLLAARYDYQIHVGDPRYASSVTLEDKLKEARAAFGIQVHGSNDIARAVKYYMYNRFKTPDTNLAHMKSTTHVFFTRPDLNLLTGMGNPTANSQTINHSESAMVWRRNPEIFKLLTDYGRCGDTNNFNMLLSNQVSSFDIQDETLTTVEAGKSWSQYEMIYGDSYSGRTAGEFTCNFVETEDYSVINLIKLWITYIDNVARGAWKPSYNLYGSGMNSQNSSHVFTKTLDYASSCYVFKCSPNGDDVLYWTKYYGVFPVNTGASALSWELGSNIGDTPKLNIRFKYSFKRDMSPISLLEFNSNANVDYGEGISEDSFNPEYGHSARPYVGAPFIEMKFPPINMRSGGVAYGKERATIRLKFRRISDSALTDDMLYRASMVGHK